MSDHLISSDAAGHPVIAGTHVTVEKVLQELAACEEAFRPILTAHPELDREGVQAALEFAAERMHGPVGKPTADFARALGEFEPRTPLAKKLWERRKAVIQEALDKGEPLLHSWEDVEREVRERRGEREIGNDL
jgi:uncharacterized protein (DUF433 family)